MEGKTMTTNKHDNYGPVDQLGFLQAQITVLELKEKKLKDRILAMGAGAHDGVLFRATVIKATRFTLPIAVATAKLKQLGVGAAWFRRNKKPSDYESVSVKARNGVPLKIAA